VPRLFLDVFRLKIPLLGLRPWTD